MLRTLSLHKDYKRVKEIFKFSRCITTTEHDFVIVGSGSAGSVLANRLSSPSDGSHEVLVLEAGPTDDTWRVSMPMAFKSLLYHPKYSWCYETTPQPEANNRTVFWPRGKVVGGSSSINAMIYIRGHPYDFDRWDKQGAKGWSYFDCLPYFKRAQSHELGEDLYRGGKGPLGVTKGKLVNPLYDAFTEAGKQAGIGLTDDFNGYKQEGFGTYDLTIKNGKRCSTAVGYLRPALKNKNLKLHTEANALKILFDKKRAIGVEYEHQGTIKHALARKEVILSAGVINTPQLLMLSGVGSKSHLTEFNIPTIVDLPGVGKNLQDHVVVYIQYRCKKPITLDTYQWKFPHKMIKAGLQWYMRGTGVASTTTMEKGAFFRSTPQMPHPDIQLHFLPKITTDHFQTMANCYGYQAIAGTQRATSVGEIKLKSNNPNDPPIINPNYLTTEQDMVDFRACVRLAREVFSQKAFDEFRIDDVQPNLKLATDKVIDDFVRATSQTLYHPLGTAKMGAESDKMAVVDTKCRVIGTEKLRVVDASIMPSEISGNLNATIIMMAEKASDIILNKNPLPRMVVPVWKAP